MPKRPNPFDDNGPLQLKTHVGMKEMANGSRQEELMKEVYERTQEKLFMAMKENSDMNTNHMQSEIGHVPSLIESASKFDPSQTLLDKTLHLASPSSGWTHTHATLPCSQAGERRNGSRWSDYGSTAMGNTSPDTCVPSTGFPLGLDASDQLRAPHECAMDCDSDLQPHSGLPLMESENSDGLAGGVDGCSAGPMAGKGVNSKENSRTGHGGLQLQGWGFLTSKPSATPEVTVQPGMCGTCFQSPFTVSCQFCDTQVCGDCCRQCFVCGFNFCHLCYTLNYDTSELRAYCLNCME